MESSGPVAFSWESASSPVGSGSQQASTPLATPVLSSSLIEERGVTPNVPDSAYRPRTIIEGEIDELAGGGQRDPRKRYGRHPPGVITNITIDDRRDKEVNMEEQVDIVTQSLR